MAQYVSNREAAEERIGKSVLRRLVEIANSYERTMQEMMREPKTGRIYGAEQVVYFRDGRGGTAYFLANAGKVLGGKGKKGAGVHRASAPGEAPAIDTAALRKGITHTISRIDRMTYAIQIGIAAQSGRDLIAKYLEFGTSRIAARPMWRPALEILRRNFESIRGEQTNG